MKPPWEKTPYHLISWWDMNEFSAHSFYLIGRLIENLLRKYKLVRQFNPALPADMEFYTEAPDEKLEEGERQHVTLIIAAIEEYCEMIELNLSIKQLKRFRDSLSGEITNKDVVENLKNINLRIRDEMEDKLFFFVPRTRSHFYLLPEKDQANPTFPRERAPFAERQESLFGKGVINAFPSAVFDFEESGKCLALARGTACVMHLSRVVEVGLKTLAVTELKLPDRPDWGRHLKDIEAELKSRYIAGKKTPDEEFYSEAAAQIGHIKTAWRNPSMHADQTYTEERAQEIFEAVRSFMKHLATRIKE